MTLAKRMSCPCTIHVYHNSCVRLFRDDEQKQSIRSVRGDRDGAEQFIVRINPHQVRSEMVPSTATCAGHHLC